MVRIAQESITYAEHMVWEPLHIEGAEGTAWVKVLGKDDSNGGKSALVKYDAGFKHPKKKSQAFADILVLEGEAKDGDKTLLRATYQYRPMGAEFGPFSTEVGITRYIRTGGIGDSACSPDEVFYQDVERGIREWDSHPQFDHLEKLKVLRTDNQSHLHVSFIFGFRPGLIQKETVIHDHSEELYVIQGGVLSAWEGDVEGRYKLIPGTYVCRQPNKSRHGHGEIFDPPWRALGIRGGYSESYDEYAGKDIDPIDGMPATTFAE